MFDIAFDPDGALLRLTIGGFWDEAETTRFVAALRERVTAIRRTHATFDVLSDARGFAIQSAETSERFGKMAAALTARRTAILVRSTLNKMQAERNMAGERLRVFTDEDAARRWLADG